MKITISEGCFNTEMDALANHIIKALESYGIKVDQKSIAAIPHTPLHCVYLGHLRDVGSPVIVEVKR